MSIGTGALLRLVADDVAAARDELNRLDGVAGDGDLGLTAQEAAAAVRTAVEAGGDDLAAMLRSCGMQVARRAPSTAGTLIATGLLAAGAAARDEATSGRSSVGLIARLLRAAESAIEERGRAQPGDKTLLDALDPAARAFEDAAASRLPLEQAVEIAATAARRGAEQTAQLEPRVGRAGWLADRSRGHVDAGAHLTALAFESAARHLSQAALQPSDVGRV